LINSLNVADQDPGKDKSTIEHRSIAKAPSIHQQTINHAQSRRERHLDDPKPVNPPSGKYGP